MRFIWIFLLAGAASAATLVSTATGNFTTDTTWGLAEAGASASQLTRTTNTNTTTSYVYSSAFTCTNTDVIEGVLVYGRQLGTTGTVSVALSDDNGTTATRELAVNATDLHTEDSPHFFQFASTLTCDGGADYKVGVKSSTNAMATFYRDGTAGNWFRVLRRNTAAAPGAGDILYITGELTAPATLGAVTVTMNETAATVYGSVSATESVGVGVGGTLTYGSAAATNYLLTIAGLVRVFGGGTWNQGTSGTRCPADSTCKLNFDLTGNVDSGFQCEAGGTCGVYGATITTVATTLSADEAAAQTVLSITATAGWAAAGEIALASTTRTASQAEKRTILTVDSGTQVTVTAGITNAHSGTSPTVAEVVYLTRNAVIQGESDSLQGFVRCATTAACTFSYVEFYRLGSATATKRGIDILTSTGSFTLQHSSLHDWIVAGSQFHMAGSGTMSVSITNNVFFNISRSAFDATSGNGWTFSNNTIVSTAGNSNVSGVNFVGATTGWTFSNNVISGIGTAATGTAVNWTGAAVPTTFSGNTIHSVSTTGINCCGTAHDVTLTNTTVWRAAGVGINITTTTGNHTRGPHFTTLTMFGNTNANIDCNGINLVSGVWSNLDLAGDSTFATARGLRANTTGCHFIDLRIRTATFGVATGIKVAHSSSDILFNSAAVQQITCDNCNLASTTPIVDETVWTFGDSNYARFAKWGQTAGSHRTYYLYGLSQTDTTIFRTASPSERLTPNSAANKLKSGVIRFAVASGETLTVTAWVRKSEAGDGAAYNGNEPRLVLKANHAAGITSDTVLDTMTAAAGTWEQLTGTTAAVTDNAVLEVYVDGDGTAGWFNVDDRAAGDQTTTGELFWFEGQPAGLSEGAAGGSCALAIGKGCVPVVF